MWCVFPGNKYGAVFVAGRVAGRRRWWWWWLWDSGRDSGRYVVVRTAGGIGGQTGGAGAEAYYWRARGRGGLRG